MLDLRIETNLPKFITQFDALARDQLPYAHAVTLTYLAKRAKDKSIESLPHSFTVRRKWISQGIRSRPAEKKDYPNSTSYVGSVDPFMPDQVLGGTKTPTGSSSLSVPVDIRKKITDTTPKSKWPSYLLASSPKDFAFISPQGEKWFIQRPRPHKTNGPRAKRGSHQADLNWLEHNAFTLLYRIETNVHIPNRWPFQEIVEKEVEAEFFETFINALEGAIASRK